MASSSNKGIILFANGDASGGAVQMPATTVPIASILAPNIQVTNRVVITLHMSFSTCTQYVVRVRLRNVNMFGTLANGFAQPATSGGSTNTSFVATALGSIAQNDASPFTFVLDHIYLSSANVTDDFIELNGALAGDLDVLVTPTGTATTNADSILIALDAY